MRPNKVLFLSGLALYGCGAREQAQAREALREEAALALSVPSPAAAALCQLGEDGARVAQEEADRIAPGEDAGRLRLSISDALVCLHQQRPASPVPEATFRALLQGEPDPATQTAMLSSWSKVRARDDLPLSVSLRAISLDAAPEVVRAGWSLSLGPMSWAPRPGEEAAQEAERAAWCAQVIPLIVPHGEAILPAEREDMRWDFEPNRRFELAVTTQCEGLSVPLWEEGWALTDLHHDILRLFREDGLRAGLDPIRAAAQAERLLGNNHLLPSAEILAPLGDIEAVDFRAIQISRHLYAMWNLAAETGRHHPEYSAELVRVALDSQPPCSAIYELGRNMEITRDTAGWMQQPWLREKLWSFSEACPHAVSGLGLRGYPAELAIDGGALHAWIGPEETAALRDRIQPPPRSR